MCFHTVWKRLNLFTQGVEMQVLRTLIDDSLKMCQGNQSELARRLGVSTSLMNAIVKGKRSLTWNHAVLMAEMTGFNIDAVLRAALIAETPMLKDGAKLREILGKGGADGEAEVLDLSYKDILTTTITNVKKDSKSVNKTIHRI